MSASTTTRRFRRYSSNSRPCVTLRSGTSLTEVPLRLLYGDGVSLAFAPRIALPPAPASSLFRPWPFHALSRPHRLPCSDPSGVAFFSVPAPFGPGHYLLRFLLFQFSLRPLLCPLLVRASSRFRKEAGLSPDGAVLSASGSRKYQSVRPKEEKIFGETAAKSYLVERNPSNP